MKEIRKTNWFLLLMVCFYVGGSYAFAWLCEQADVPYNVRIMSGQILIGLSLISYLLFTRTNPFKVIQHRRLGIIDILLVILLMFLMMPLVYFINYISMFFTENTTATTIAGMKDNPYWMNLLMLALTPAIIEETICRGIMFHAYKKRSFLVAVLLSAFIFGLIHMNLNQMLYAATIGVAFALAVEATGSIYSSMIMHFIMNSVSVTALAFLKFMENLGLYSDELLEQQAQMDVGIPASPAMTAILLAVVAMVVIGTTTLAVGVIILLAKRNGRSLKGMFKRTSPESAETMSETQGVGIIGFKNSMIDIPFILAVIVCLLVMIFL